MTVKSSSFRWVGKWGDYKLWTVGDKFQPRPVRPSKGTEDYKRKIVSLCVYLFFWSVTVSFFSQSQSRSDYTSYISFTTVPSERFPYKFWIIPNPYPPHPVDVFFSFGPSPLPTRPGFRDSVLTRSFQIFLTFRAALITLDPYLFPSPHVSRNILSSSWYMYFPFDSQCLWIQLHDTY